jgi:hypothetical protein
MKKWLKVLMVVVAVILFAVPEWACSQVLVVCRRFIADEACYRCSDYFYVDSEDEAQSRCGELGADPYYFPGIGRMAVWMRGHCSCEGMDPAP